MSDLLLGGLIVAFAAARLWRLAGVDTITERPREWVLTRTPEKVRTLVECPWCLGSWTAFALWTVWVVAEPSHPWITALAVAHVVGMIGER